MSSSDDCDALMQLTDLPEDALAELVCISALLWTCTYLSDGKTVSPVELVHSLHKVSDGKFGRLGQVEATITVRPDLVHACLGRDARSDVLSIAAWSIV